MGDIGEPQRHIEFEPLTEPVSRHHRDAKAALAANPALHQALTLTLTPGEAAALRDELDDATLEPWSCQYPGCPLLADGGDFCPRHDLDDEVCWSNTPVPLTLLDHSGAAVEASLPP